MSLKQIAKDALQFITQAKQVEQRERVTNYKQLLRAAAEDELHQAGQGPPASKTFAPDEAIRILRDAGKDDVRFSEEVDLVRRRIVARQLVDREPELVAASETADKNEREFETQAGIQLAALQKKHAEQREKLRAIANVTQTERLSVFDARQFLVATGAPGEEQKQLVQEIEVINAQIAAVEAKVKPSLPPGEGGWPSSTNHPGAFIAYTERELATLDKSRHPDDANKATQLRADIKGAKRNLSAAEKELASLKTQRAEIVERSQACAGDRMVPENFLPPQPSPKTPDQRRKENAIRLGLTPDAPSVKINAN